MSRPCREFVLSDQVNSHHIYIHIHPLSLINSHYVLHFSISIRSLGGANNHPNPEQMCTRIRQVKIMKDVDLLVSKKTNVKLSSVEDEENMGQSNVEDEEEEIIEPFLGAELGGIYCLAHIHFIVPDIMDILCNLQYVLWRGMKSVRLKTPR